MYDREKLKYRRKANGYTQTDIAKATGISQQKISYIERGKHAPSAEPCIGLADFQGISLDNSSDVTFRRSTATSTEINNERLKSGTENSASQKPSLRHTENRSRPPAFTVLIRPRFSGKNFAERRFFETALRESHSRINPCQTMRYAFAGRLVDGT